jgi:20S proteasome subunit beta 1
MALEAEASVKTVATLVMQLGYQNKNQFQAGMIVAGWDKDAGASVYGIPLGGSLIKVTPHSASLLWAR